MGTVEDGIVGLYFVLGWIHFLISTRGALRLPTTYDNQLSMVMVTTNAEQEKMSLPHECISQCVRLSN